jgi:peptide/nickel transport system permease protein
MLDIAHHLVLPAVVMAIQIGSFNYLVTRASVVGELGSDYLGLARAKGLGERVIKYHHALRNALLPMVSLSAMQLAFVLTVASAFVETVFAYPGLGRLSFDAVAARDYPLLQGCFLIVSVLVVSLNAAADALHARLDPRTTA